VPQGGQRRNRKYGARLIGWAARVSDCRHRGGAQGCPRVMPEDYPSATLDELARKGDAIGTKLALVGLDGFVDRIIHPVAQRLGPGENFTPFASLAEFGQRVEAAAGKSANIELYLQREKLGGNGPIMASALLAAGLSVRYIGALGRPAIHPLFAEFARRTQAVSVANPGVTHALEFADGKLMLGETTSLEDITYARLLETVGEGALLDLLARANLIALVNWTMIPKMSFIFEDLLTKALPTLDARPRHFFFDLADPAKRPRDELHAALRLIGRFQNFGNVTLGLNLAEAQQAAAALGVDFSSTAPDDLRLAATRIRQTLDAGCVVIHPTGGAACATRDGSWWVEGPHCANPVITTGAGDHFNAGFAAGQLLGLPPPCSLTLAVTFSGYYVRFAKSPTLGEAAAFLRTG
jgi:sugar/nucleoside kinase (ribokinase family)